MCNQNGIRREMKYVKTLNWLLLALFVVGCSTTGSEKMESMDPNASGYVKVVGSDY